MNRARRKAVFSLGKCLGREDHVVRWPKPQKPRTIDRKTYNSLPDFLEIRELRILVEQPGFRPKEIIVVTTLLDPYEFTKSELAQLFRARWNNELDIRNIKETLQMGFLRCKTPELVRKEIWTHILAYNLIRTVIAQAATKHQMLPRTISFKAAVQTLKAFQPKIAPTGQGAEFLNRLYQQLLNAVAEHRVADRPDRFEPRKIKRRHGKYDLLTRTRQEEKVLMAQGLAT